MAASVGAPSAHTVVPLRSSSWTGDGALLRVEMLSVGANACQARRPLATRRWRYFWSSGALKSSGWTSSCTLRVPACSVSVRCWTSLLLAQARPVQAAPLGAGAACAADTAGDQHVQHFAAAGGIGQGQCESHGGAGSIALAGLRPAGDARPLLPALRQRREQARCGDRHLAGGRDHYLAAPFGAAPLPPMLAAQSSVSPSGA
jgi:hypothetical protein